MIDISPAMERRLLPALGLAAALLYGIGMTRAGFEGKDERRYAQVAKELRLGRDMFVLHYLGDLYPDKPPLVFWAEGVCYALFGGVSPGAARLPLMLSALLALGFGYLAMRQIDGRREALIGAILLALSFRFLWAGRWVKLDMQMLTFTYAAYWASARLLFPKAEQKAAGLGWALLAWAFAALAALSKGPGALTWLLTILAYAAIRREWAPVRCHRMALGMLLFVAIGAVWLIPAMILGGPEYYGPMFGTHVRDRMVGIVRHVQPMAYFFYKMPSDMLPAGLFLPVAVWWALARRRADWRLRGIATPGGGEGDRGQTAFLLVWFLGTLLFFSLPAGKRGQYILPAYAAGALLIARFIVAALSADEGAPRKLLAVHLWVLSAALAAGGAGLAALGGVVTPEFSTPLSLFERAALLLALAGAGAAGLLLLRRGRLGSALAANAAGVFAAYLVLFGSFFPKTRDDTAPREVARFVAEHPLEGARLGIYFTDIADRFTLYGEGIPAVLAGRDEAGAFMAEDGPRWLAVSNGNYTKYVALRGRPDWIEAGRWAFAAAMAEEADATIRAADILDPPAMARRLLDEADTAARRVWSFLPEPAQGAARRLLEAPEDHEALERLAQGLDAARQDVNLYDADALAGIELDHVARGLLRGGDSEARQANRLAIEAIFPREMARSRDVILFANPAAAQAIR